MDRRNQILNGILSSPVQIRDFVNNPEFDNMFQSLWHNYLLNEEAETSVAYWADRFNDTKAFVVATRLLSKGGWIIVKMNPTTHWGTIKLNGSKLLKWVSKEELKQVRKEFKFNKYMMPASGSSVDNIAKTPKGKIDIGLSRPGTAKAGQNKFKYDNKMLWKYRKPIIQNVTKSMRKLAQQIDIALEDETGYAYISEELVNAYIAEPDKEFCMGKALMDSRGRAIFEGLSKVANPIGFKDFRALIKIEPRPLNPLAYSQVFLAISELLGYKLPSVEERIQAGREAYQKRILPKIDMTTDEGREELHERIWLERIYKALENPSQWDVPIELDQTASALQFMGILLNDKGLLDGTNVIGSELKDIWTIDGLARNQVKKAITPRIYGSQAEPAKLWNKNHIKYNICDVKTINNEINHGRFATANMFKDFIIDNANPEEEMKIKIFNEEFTVFCNKYETRGEYIQPYVAYDTEAKEIRVIKHTHTKRVADLDSFRTYLVTLLIHNLDSQLADYIANNVDWIIPIYDAFIVHPNDAKTVRKLFVDFMLEISNNRDTILKDYFQSINIDLKTNKRAIIQWNKLQEKIEKVGEFIPQGTALK